MARTVYIFHRASARAAHHRMIVKRTSTTTVPEHMAFQSSALRGWTNDRIPQGAAAIGPCHRALCRP